MSTKNVDRLLKFIVKYPGWSSYGKDQSTVRAVRVLERKGVIETNEFRQMRLALPQWALEALDKARNS